MTSYNRDHLTFILSTDPSPADSHFSDEPLNPEEWRDIAGCLRHGDPADHDGDTGDTHTCTCCIGRL